MSYIIIIIEIFFFWVIWYYAPVIINLQWKVLKFGLWFRIV